MNWLTYSILSSIIGSARSITEKEGLLHTLESSFASYMSLVALIISLIYNIINKVPFDINKFAVLAGLFQGIAVLLILDSINKSDNPGLPMAFFRCQAVLTAIASVFLFKAKLPIHKLIAMCFVILGVYILAKSLDKKESFTDNPNDPEEIKKRIKTIIPITNWIIIAIIAGIFMTVKDIFTKYALLSKNSNTPNIIFYGFLVQTIIMFVYEYYVSRNIKLKDKNNDKIVACKDKLIIVVVGIILYGYVYTLTNACKLAPNIGFVKSIDCLGIVATILLSNLIFKTKLNKQSYLGILITIISIMVVSI